MNSYRIIFSFIFCVSLFPGFSQSKDKAAKLVLDEFSSKTMELPGARSDFLFTIKDMNDNSGASIRGSFLIKGEKYKLVTGDMEIYYDGETLWNYIIDADEVNVLTPPDEPDPDSYFENPVRFFRIYEKDFFYKYVGEESIEGKDLHIIDLYPKDLKRSFTRIRLRITRDNTELYSAEYFGKSKIHYTLKILSFTIEEIPGEAFVFDAESHPNVDIIDLR